MELFLKIANTFRIKHPQLIVATLMILGGLTAALSENLSGAHSVAVVAALFGFAAMFLAGATNTFFAALAGAFTLAAMVGIFSFFAEQNLSTLLVTGILMVLSGLFILISVAWIYDKVSTLNILKIAVPYLGVSILWYLHFTCNLFII